MTPQKTDMDEDAERQWIARAIAEPDAWRSRASNAAGLLSAAAAATLTGLLLRGDELLPAPRLLAASAAVLYSVAVLYFLSAAVHPPPPEDKTTISFVAEVWAYCGKETRPIKRRVKRGTRAGGAAIVATSLAAILVVVSPRSLPRGQVALTAEAPAEVEELCPKLPGSFEAEYERLDDGRVRLHLDPGVCGSDSAVLELNRSAVVIKSQDD